MNFESERLKYILVSSDDLENIHHLHSIPEVDEFNTLGIPDSMDDSRKLVEQMINSNEKKEAKSLTWTISLKKTSEFIGLCGFTLSKDKFRLGEIYYKFLPKYWGNGFATESAKALIKLGFEELNLHKVEAGVATENIVSVRVLEKAGMIREGLRRKILPIRGNWVDNYHYAIVEDDQGNEKGEPI